MSLHLEIKRLASEYKKTRKELSRSRLEVAMVERWLDETRARRYAAWIAHTQAEKALAKAREEDLCHTDTVDQQ